MALFGGRKKNNKPQPTGNGESGDAAPPADAEAAQCAAPEFSEKTIAAARKWFQQAAKLVSDRNYDYAIESYLSGLKFWPEAVEEGHQPLRAAAVARRETGGKKAGALEKMKRATSGKDAVEALLNAEWLWTRDPSSMAHMESMVKNAAKAKLEATLLFIAPIYFESAKVAKKISKNPFLLLRKSYNELGERCETRGDFKLAVKFYQGTLTVLDVLRSLTRATMEFDHELTDLATRITIMKGKYDTGVDFRASMKDTDAQKDIHDRERMVMDGARLEELIEDARQDRQDNPQVSAKLLHLIDLLCRDESKERQEQAIKLLDDEHATSENYTYKQRADDIRMKRLRRKVREVAATKDKNATRQAQVEQLKFELSVFKERAEAYPTDNKIKFEYGKRLLRARKIDAAIPMLQEARNDPKNRVACMLYIGQCFVEKALHAQAISTLKQAIKEYELAGDNLSKELHYWLGRANEAAGKKDDAAEAFGQVIQWDYNYKDVRTRLEGLEG